MALGNSCRRTEKVAATVLKKVTRWEGTVGLRFPANRLRLVPNTIAAFTAPLRYADGERLGDQAASSRMSWLLKRTSKSVVTPLPREL